MNTLIISGAVIFAIGFVLFWVCAIGCCIFGWGD